MAITNDQMKFIIKSNHYLEGGTKEACIQLRQFIQSHDKTVLDDSHIAAIRTLVAASFIKEDEVPKKYHCENDCHFVAQLLCRGEMNIDKESADLCPFYSDDGNW